MSSSSLPPIHSTTPNTDIAIHLQHIIASATQPYTLYPHEISYKDKAQRDRAFQSPLDDTCHGHTYQQFKHHPLLPNVLKAGLFATGRYSTIGEFKQFPSLDGHAWVGIVFKKPTHSKNTIVIWDPDGAEIMETAPHTYNGITSNRQKNLVDLYKGRSKLNGVYYGGKGNESRLDCLLLSVEFLQELMIQGLPEDLEAAGYVRLS